MASREVVALAQMVIQRRLDNAMLARPERRTPAEIVAWHGAVQAQDYPGARWGVGQRAIGLTDAEVERAYDEGAILRTHVMRPTWHFVAPADIRWLLALTAPRVHQASAYYHRQQALDAKTFARAEAVMVKVLRGGHHLTRVEIGAALARAGIAADGMRLSLLMMHAELEAVICSGPRRGKQFTYALLDERAPQATALNLKPDAALAELTRRYFASHGPATVRDYVWWSGLTARDAKRGIALVQPALVEETVGELTYYSGPADSATAGSATRAVEAHGAAPESSRGKGKAGAAEARAWLLPNYDEYLIAYKDRDLVVGGPPGQKPSVRPPDRYPYHLVIDGRLAGSWKRTVTPKALEIDVATYARVTPAQRRVIEAAAAHQAAFMQRTVTLRYLIGE